MSAPVIDLDAGQWFMLKKIYDSCAAEMTPFVRANIDTYFRRHDEDNRTVDNVEELDAIIALCNYYESKKKHKRTQQIMSVLDETMEESTDSFAEDEFYETLMELLNRLHEQREQYRLLHVNKRTR